MHCAQYIEASQCQLRRESRYRTIFDVWCSDPNKECRYIEPFVKLQTRPRPSRNGFLLIEQKRPDRSEIVQDLRGTFLTISTHVHESKLEHGRS